MRNLVLFCMCITALSAKNINNEDQSAQLEDTIDNGKDAILDENSSLENQITAYLMKSNFSFQLPGTDSTIVLDARDLDEDELNLKLDFSSDSGIEARKKSKIKKIFVPILVFILLKAMVLVPLALGILGIKTWNAIQLSFISFVSALVLAVWKLCSKVNHDHPPAIIHSAWDPYHHDRSDTAQQLAYSNYTPS